MLGTTRAFKLRVVQSGTHARGLYEEDGMSVDVEGDVGLDGALVMKGYAPPITPDGASFTVTNLTLRYGAAGSLQGSVSWERPAPPAQASFSLGLKVSGDIISATRTDLAALGTRSFDRRLTSASVRMAGESRDSVRCSKRFPRRFVDRRAAPEALANRSKSTHARSAS
jgi:hypothetical protein